MSGEEIQEIEPNCRGVGAIHSPHTGIVDWGLVARTYGEVFEQMGGTIATGCNVNSLRFVRGMGAVYILNALSCLLDIRRDNEPPRDNPLSFTSSTLVISP